MQKQIQINNGYRILAIKSRFLSKTEKSGNKEDLVQAKTFFLKYIFFCLFSISPVFRSFPFFLVFFLCFVRGRKERERNETHPMFTSYDLWIWFNVTSLFPSLSLLCCVLQPSDSHTGAELYRGGLGPFRRADVRVVSAGQSDGGSDHGRRYESSVRPLGLWLCHDVIP